MTESEYEALAYPELSALMRALDALEHERFEVELAGDILTLEFSDGTRYVINSHRAARQIWMAADRNAWHFDWVEDRRAWIAAKTGAELWATVAERVGGKLGEPVVLSRA